MTEKKTDRQKSFVMYNDWGNNLDEFTNEDVMRCFNLSSASSARGKVSRLMRDHLVEKIREERGTAPALYQKTGSILL